MSNGDKVDISKDSMALISRTIQIHSNSATNSALIYLRSLAYSTVYDLHKAFTKSILLQKNIRDVFRRSKLSSDGAGSNIAGSLTFYGGQPQILPMDKWIVESIVKMTGSGNITVEPVSTHPMYKSELESLTNGSLNGKFFKNEKQDSHYS